MLEIQIILGSTRPLRKGEIVAKWVLNEAVKRKDFHSELIDLKDYPLPFYDEPESPSVLKKYTHREAAKWADKIRSADGYIIVTPEYNHGYPAVLKNALDYVYYPWNNKPVAFISYGASAKGARAVEQLRQVVAELQMVSVRNSLHLSLASLGINDKWEMENPKVNSKLQKLFDQLIFWAQILRKAREVKK